MQQVASERVWSSREKQIIDGFATQVRGALKDRVQRIILYGSRARGDADDESDYDFLVLLEPYDKTDKRIVRELSREISYDHGVLVTAFVARFSEFTEDRYFYFYENVCKEGIEL